MQDVYFLIFWHLGKGGGDEVCVFLIQPNYLILPK
jgi:hypothetical protein